jgi:hypothetical protein
MQGQRRQRDDGGDRRRNARRERLRAVLPRDGAVIGIHLAEDKQTLPVIDHDVPVLARKTVKVKAFRLGEALDWAVAQARVKGFERVAVACEPTGPRWLLVQRLCAERGPAAGMHPAADAQRRGRARRPGLGCGAGGPAALPRDRAAGRGGRPASGTVPAYPWPGDAAYAGAAAGRCRLRRPGRRRAGRGPARRAPPVGRGHRRPHQASASRAECHCALGGRSGQSRGRRPGQSGRPRTREYACMGTDQLSPAPVSRCMHNASGGHCPRQERRLARGRSGWMVLMFAVCSFPPSLAALPRHGSPRGTARGGQGPYSAALPSGAGWRGTRVVPVAGQGSSSGSRRVR